MFLPSLWQCKHPTGTISRLHGSRLSTGTLLDSDSPLLVHISHSTSFSAQPLHWGPFHGVLSLEVLPFTSPDCPYCFRATFASLDNSCYGEVSIARRQSTVVHFLLMTLMMGPTLQNCGRDFASMRMGNPTALKPLFATVVPQAQLQQLLGQYRHCSNCHTLPMRSDATLVCQQLAVLAFQISSWQRISLSGSSTTTTLLTILQLYRWCGAPISQLLRQRCRTTPVFLTLPSSKSTSTYVSATRPFGPPVFPSHNCHGLSSSTCPNYSSS